MHVGSVHLQGGSLGVQQAAISPYRHINIALDRADPVIKIAIEPKSKSDLEKMSNGLIKLAQEDPSFNFSRDEETNQTVIEGMGELHLDIIVDRLRREFKVGQSLMRHLSASSSAKHFPQFFSQQT